MRAWFSDKILIAEPVQRKWPKTKGQILPGALFLPWVQEESLFSKDICKPLDKISARAPGLMPGRLPQTSEAISLVPSPRSQEVEENRVGKSQTSFSAAGLVWPCPLVAACW